MTKANGEAIIFNDIENISGFLISPDFDTGQSMAISKLMKSITHNECFVSKTTFEHNGLSLPVLIFTSNNDTNNIEIENYMLLNLLSYAKKCVEDVNYIKSFDFAESFNKTCINKENYYISSKDNFFVFVYSSECVVFVLNPYVYIMNENEIMQNRKRIDGYMKLKGYSSCVNSYIENLENRRRKYVLEMNKFFDNFVSNVSDNGCVVGSGTMFLRSGYLILTGTKNDVSTCYERNLFPYEIKDNKIRRYSNEELSHIEEEKREYEEKCAIVEERISFIKTLLSEKGFSWDTISTHKVNFDKETGEYRVWMNAQVYDNAHYGWFTEQDFIDWLNMEGKIPYFRARVSYFGKMLEKVSNGEYLYSQYIPLDNTKKYSQYDDYDTVGVFKKNSKKITMTLPAIIRIIEEYQPISKYTIEDLEKGLQKHNGFFSKIKKILKHA